jgi:hypothetical protein
MTCLVQLQQQQQLCACRAATAAAAKEHCCERSSALLADGQRNTLSMYACMDVADCGQQWQQGSQSSPSCFLLTTASDPAAVCHLELHH